MKAFTLIEVIIVIAIMVIVMMVCVGLFLANNRFYSTSSGEIRSVNATRDAADRLGEYARGADELVASRVFGSFTYITGATAVVMRLPSIDSPGNLVAGSYDYVMLGRDTGNASRLLLIMDGAAGSARKDRTLEITDRLSAISLTYDNADPALANQIVYTITVTQSGPNAASEQVTGTATLRN